MKLNQATKYILIGLGVLLIVFAGYFVYSKLILGSGNISITTIPSGAKIVIDGKSYTSPVKIPKLNSGRHKIVTTKPGFKERFDSIKVSKDKTVEVNLRLYTSKISPATLKESVIEDQKTLTDFEKLIQYLPYSNLHLKIEYLVVAREPSIKITLYARLNRPDQIESYKQQLTDYGQEALDWIKSNGVNTEKLNIIWAPKNPFKS